MKTMKETEEVGPAEASRRLNIGLDHLYSLLWAAKLKARKVNGRWLISVAAIEERMARKALTAWEPRPE